MKIYIAGKIAADENYREKFARAEREQIDAGRVVINPATLPDGLTTAERMRICFAMIDVADVVCFLPDYRSSPGAMLELYYCRYIGKDIMMQPFGGAREEYNA